MFESFSRNMKLVNESTLKFDQQKFGLTYFKLPRELIFRKSISCSHFPTYKNTSIRLFLKRTRTHLKSEELQSGNFYSKFPKFPKAKNVLLFDRKNSELLSTNWKSKRTSSTEKTLTINEFVFAIKRSKIKVCVMLMPCWKTFIESIFKFPTK